MSSSRSREPEGIEIRAGLRPGDLGGIVRLHGVLYAEAFGWDATFEGYVAGPLAEFALAASTRGRVWVVEKDGQVRGSIAIVEAGPEVAQLRWFLLHPELRGLGLGRGLLNRAIEFCRSTGYRSIILWTEARLATAAALYASVGFRLMEERTHVLWGDTVTEQRYELLLI